ncbi:Hypothetical protein FKW44_006947, partial [Caligus rogercresseyi]
ISYKYVSSNGPSGFVGQYHDGSLGFKSTTNGPWVLLATTTTYWVFKPITNGQT